MKFFQIYFSYCNKCVYKRTIQSFSLEPKPKCIICRMYDSYSLSPDLNGINGRDGFSVLYSLGYATTDRSSGERIHSGIVPDTNSVLGATLLLKYYVQIIKQISITSLKRRRNFC